MLGHLLRQGLLQTVAGDVEDKLGALKRIVDPLFNPLHVLVQFALVGLGQADVAAFRREALGGFVDALVQHLLRFAEAGERHALLEKLIEVEIVPCQEANRI